MSYDIIDMSTINVEIRKQIKIMYNNDISVDEVIEGVQRLKHDDIHKLDIPRLHFQTKIVNA